MNHLVICCLFTYINLFCGKNDFDVSHITEVINEPIGDSSVHKEIQSHIYKTYTTQNPGGSAGVAGGVDGNTCDTNNVIIISILKNNLKGENIWGIDFGSGTGCTALTITACTEFHIVGVEVNEISILIFHIWIYLNLFDL